MTSRLDRSPRWLALYRGAALLTFNTVLAFALMNGCAAAVLRFLPAEAGVLEYGIEDLSRVYPGSSPEEVRALLDESWSREYVYEPFTQFREQEFHGAYVNVAAAGYRETGVEAPWPPDGERLNVFAFGGSTTFGYGLADEDAIPAALQRELASRCDRPVAVYNFARSNYYSSQERVLFDRLLAGGTVPDFAVFVDGLNEFGYPSDAPKFTRTLEHLMAETSARTLRRWVVDLPLGRLLKRWVDRDLEGEAVDVERPAAEPIVDRWLFNVELIRATASRLGVPVLHVWQPVPMYRYDLEHHLFADRVEAHERSTAEGYDQVEALRGKLDGPLVEGFLWLGDLQRSRPEPLYVDRVHYTAAFSASIAGEVAAAVAPKLCNAAEPT